MSLFSSTNQPDPKTRDKTLVFVYGTLLSGFGNHRLLDNPEARLVAKGSIRAKMFTAHWGYPHIRFSHSSNDRVIGEIYEVSWSLLLNSLDHLEGYSPKRAVQGGCLYYRKHVTVHVTEVITSVLPEIIPETRYSTWFTQRLHYTATPKGVRPSVIAWVYVAGDHLAGRDEPIPSGDWRTARAEREAGKKSFISDPCYNRVAAKPLQRGCTSNPKASVSVPEDDDYDEELIQRWLAGDHR